MLHKLVYFFFCNRIVREKREGSIVMIEKVVCEKLDATNTFQRGAERECSFDSFATYRTLP